MQNCKKCWKNCRIDEEGGEILNGRKKEKEKKKPR